MGQIKPPSSEKIQAVLNQSREEAAQKGICVQELLRRKYLERNGIDPDAPTEFSSSDSLLDYLASDD